MHDEAIIKRLATKDEKTFQELVQSFRKHVYLTCLGFVQDEDDAEDVTQEVFIEVFRSVEKFRGDSKLSTWIYRIAVNKSLNYLRKHKKTRSFISIDQLFHLPHSNNETFESNEPSTEDKELEKKELSKVLEKAIHSLPSNQQIAFTLSKYDELPYQEIADVMKISLSAVESLIHRAKLNLQKKLINYRKDKY